MKKVIWLILVVIVASVVGCARGKVRGPVVGERGELTEGEVRVVWQNPAQTPEWVQDIRKVSRPEPDKLYFVGTALPNEYEAKSLDSALDNAASEISKYLFETVDERLYFSDKLRNSVGFVPVQALAHDTVGKHISTAIIRGKYPIENFTRFCQKKEYGAIISYYDIKRLVAFPRNAAQEALKHSREEIQKEAQRERDEVKKELLQQSTKMLEGMEAEIAAGK